MKDELDTKPIMEAARREGKPIFVPRIEGSELGFYADSFVGDAAVAGAEVAACGADSASTGAETLPAACIQPAAHLQPAACIQPAATLQPEHFPALIITPGLAFDRSLNRLGRGRGYYDRFFAALDAAGRPYAAIGLCMDCQLVDEVPVEAWDKTMDMLLTESGLIRGQIIYDPS
jgi:5-formyltetrahydrofolate cyclo-ligase